jgi:D-specific alpha-keto acid dehydrogenase
MTRPEPTLLTASSPHGTSGRPPDVPLGLTIYGGDLDEAALFRAMAPRFAVSLTVTAAPLSAETVKLASGGPCVSVGHKTRVENSILLALSRVGVRYLSTRSVGLDHIDVDFAERVGIRVESAGYSPDGVADYTLMLMLMAVRSAAALGRRMDAHDYRLADVRARELRDLTVGVIGTGSIGAAVIDRLRGFGCRILAYDQRSAADTEYVNLDHLVECCDIVTLHTPLSPITHHLLDRTRIAQLKDGAIVVNTARGALIDTEALVNELESGRLGGAALDVLEGEEGIFYSDYRSRALDHPALARLQALPNVIVSPHTAFYTDHALADIVENTLAGCIAFDGGANEGGE